jgi:hypothetical protein
MGSVVPFRATGPRTSAGKRISSMNSLKSGLHAKSIVVAGIEDEAEYRAFARAVVAELGANSPLMLSLAERVVSAIWRSRRPRRLEAELLSGLAAKALPYDGLAIETESFLGMSRCRQMAFQILNEPNAQRRIDAETLETAAAAIDDALALDCSISRARHEQWLSLRSVAPNAVGAEPTVDEVNDRFFQDAESTLRLEDRGGSTAGTARKTFEALRRSLPAALARSSWYDFSWAVVRNLTEIESVTLTRIAESRGRAGDLRRDALLLDENDARRIADAEKRLDGQVSRALADFFAAARVLTDQNPALNKAQ